MTTLATVSRLTYLSLLAVLPAQAAPVTYPALRLEPNELRTEVDLLRRALDHIHPGLTRYASQAELDAAFAKLEKSCSKSMSDVEFYRAVSLTCATIRCGHTRVMAPRIDKFRAGKPTHLPFTFRIFDQQLVVDVVADGIEGLQRGDRVLRVQGRPVASLLAEIGATVGLDGYADSVRPSRLDTAYEFADTGLDHYLPAWIGFCSKFDLEVQRGGKRRSVTVSAIDRTNWQELKPAARDFVDATSWRRLDKTTAILVVDSFVNYRRPIDATARYRTLFREIEKAKVEHLIVDLRQNGGGSDDASWPLARFLAAKTMVVMKSPLVRNYRCPEDLRSCLSTWEKNVWRRPKELFKPVDGGYEVSPLVVGPLTIVPHEDRFQGRVTILSSRYNASGSTMLIACLQKKAGIRVVGESTGGAPRGPTAGLLFTLELPKSGLRINIPAMRVRTTVDAYDEGLGVAPDDRIEISRQDFLAKRDPVLAAARRGSN